MPKKFVLNRTAISSRDSPEEILYSILSAILSISSYCPEHVSIVIFSPVPRVRISSLSILFLIDSIMLFTESIMFEVDR